MAYIAQLDKTIRQWETESGLHFSVQQYNTSNAKLQIGPRVVGPEGKKVRVNVGRLTQDELKWMFAHNEEILNAMALAVAPPIGENDEDYEAGHELPIHDSGKERKVDE